MNKLTFKRVEQLFLQKYPDGNIWQTTASNKSNYSVSVAFKSNGRVYNYIVSNYVDLVNKLNLDVKLMYEHTYNTITKQIEDIQKDINKGYWEDDTGFFGEDTIIYFTEIELNNKKTELEYLQQQIKNIELV